MKKTLLLSLITLLGATAATAAVVDFTFIHQGNRLSYSPISSSNGYYTCQTCAGMRPLSGGDYIAGAIYLSGSYASGDLIIPDKVNLYEVIAIGSRSFYRLDGLTSVTIPNSVTSIGTKAFYGCSSLTSVDIPNKVKKIYDHTFAGCSSLTSVTIPSAVTSIGEGAFYDCSSLTSLTIPNSVTSIDANAFNGCSGLTVVEYLSETPCTANENIFSSDVYDNATLIIPEGMTDVYMETTPWNLFKNIVEEGSLSAIDTVEADNTTIGAIDYSAPYDVYNLQGIRVAGSLSNLAPGIYIIRQGDKTAKIAIK